MGCILISEPVTVSGDRITFGLPLDLEMEPVISGRDELQQWMLRGQAVINDQERIHLAYVRLRRT